jgi:hypothetical protein
MIRNETRKLAQRLALAGVASASALLSVVMTGDGLLRAQFDTAFDDQATAAGGEKQIRTAVQQPIAANEDYWLGDARRSPATPAIWNTPSRLAIGDGITLTMGASQQRLIVTGIKTLAAGAIQASADTLGKDHVLLTLRPLDHSGGSIHLLLDSDSALSPTLRLSQHAREL